MKKCLSVLLGCLSILSSTGQTALKGNLTDPVLGRYGISVEHRLAKAVSGGVEVDALSREIFLEGQSWFLSQNAHKRGLIVEPFVRWYPSGAEDLGGVYASLGGFFGFAKYTLDEPDGLGRHTWSANGASLHLGWQKCLGRLALDMCLGTTSACLAILTELTHGARETRRCEEDRDTQYPLHDELEVAVDPEGATPTPGPPPHGE